MLGRSYRQFSGIRFRCPLQGRSYHQFSCRRSGGFVGRAAVLRFVALIVGVDARASLWPFFDHCSIPKPHFLCLPGDILAPFGSILVALGTPGCPKGTLWCQRFIFHRFWVPLGSPLGVTLAPFFDNFPCFLMLKLEIGLRTCFLRGFRMEK